MPAKWKAELTHYVPLITLTALVALIAAAEPSFLRLSTLMGLVSDTMTLCLMAKNPSSGSMAATITLVIEATACTDKSMPPIKITNVARRRMSMN